MSTDVSIIIGAYNMQRELPRTIFTFGRDYQRGSLDRTYEIIVADNGSSPAVDQEELQAIDPCVRVVRSQAPSPSAADLINRVANASAGRLIGIVIDGARMASPGVLSAAWDAYRADPRRAIGTYAFHLGPDVQTRSMLSGYDQRIEDELLATVPWRENGYRLFDIAVLATSSRRGWFGIVSESNAVFLDRELWRTLGGLDERFKTPGGGYVNLDFWNRAVTESGAAPWMILGEGTFHQFHGGAATNGTDDVRASMRREYEIVKGKRHRAAQYEPRLIGSLNVDLARRFGGRKG